MRLCPGAWHYRNSTNALFFISSTKLDQPTARTECLSMIADLASVSDQAEMDYLASISWVLAALSPVSAAR